MTFAIAWAFLRSGVSSVFTFCSKPPGSWIAAALGLVFGFWLWGHHQYAAGVSHCEALHAEASANELARQKTVVADADKRSVDRTTESETRNIQNRTIVRVIHDQAAAMPDHDATCIPADIADRLREIH